jgi:hypothetical protein
MSGAQDRGNLLNHFNKPRYLHNFHHNFIDYFLKLAYTERLCFCLRGVS